MIKLKLSNEKIVNDSNTLSTISQKQLPIKASYAIAKNVSKIEVELKIYNTERQKLIEKYAEKGEDGKVKSENGSIKIQKEHIEDWNKDMKELMAIENEIDIHKFSMNEFDGKAYDLSPSEFMAIDYMIEEE